MKRISILAWLLCLAFPASLMGAILTVRNQTGITLQAMFKDPKQPYQYINIASQDSHDFSSDDYFSVTLRDPDKPYLAITSEQYSDGLGFKPDRANRYARCNDYDCAFALIDDKHGQLSIGPRTDGLGWLIAIV